MQPQTLCRRAQQCLRAAPVFAPSGIAVETFARSHAAGIDIDTDMIRTDGLIGEPTRRIITSMHRTGNRYTLDLFDGIATASLAITIYHLVNCVGICYR